MTEQENTADIEILYAVEFDDYQTGVSRMEVRSLDNDSTIVSIANGVETIVFSADRDQFGVWLLVGKMSVAQRDGTRSFINGLIKCLQVISDHNERDTTEATTVIAPHNEISSTDNMVLYRYRWIYSEGPGKWFVVEIPSDWSKDKVEDEMDFIEESDGSKNGCRWNNFQYNNI